MPRALFASVLACLAVLFCSPSARADETPRAKSGPKLTQIGLIVFGGAYAWSAGTGAVYRDTHGEVMPSMFVPVVGPYAAVRKESIRGESLLTGRAIDAFGANDCEGEAILCPAVLPFLPFAVLEVLMLYGAPVAQAAGLVVTAVGLASDDGGRERDRVSAAPRPKVAVAPGATAGGVGLSLSVTQW